MILSLVLSVPVSVAMLIGIFFAFLDFGYSQSDFYMEIKLNRGANDIVWDITNFTVSGESGKEICPSGQCVAIDERNSRVNSPDPETMYFFYDIDFRLKDNTTGPNLGPLKKEFLEQFSSGIDCPVDDIIEENGQELYYCHGENTISRILDSKTWDYDATVKYDPKNYVLKVNGNLK